MITVDSVPNGYYIRISANDDLIGIERVRHLYRVKKCLQDSLNLSKFEVDKIVHMDVPGWGNRIEPYNHKMALNLSKHRSLYIEFFLRQEYEHAVMALKLEFE